MVPLISLLSLALFAASLPNGLAGPACSQKHYSQQDCVAVCSSKWGWPGKMMGNDRWGNVMHNEESSNSWNATVDQACGSETSSQNLTQPVANPQTESFTSGSVVPTTSDYVVSATSSYPEPGLPSPSSTSVLTRVTSAKASTVTHIISTPVVASTTSVHVIHTTSTTQPHAQTTQPVSVASDPHGDVSTNNVPNPPPIKTTTSAQQSSPAENSSTGGGTSSGDIQTYLSAHNTVRAEHGASPLTWSNDLASKAQQWANGCVFQHSGGTLGPFGENLAAGTGSSYGIQPAIDSWTAEVSQYNAADPQASHFTQVVWKATTQVGCAVQICDTIFPGSEAQYYVCEYSPQGNVIGEFAENVQV